MMTQDEINVSLFDKVKRLQKELSPYLDQFYVATVCQHAAIEVSNIVELLKEHEDKAAKLEEENIKLKKALAAVRTLMNNSEGVSGLHMNGDVAPWDELLECGQFEEWLIEFSNAESIANAPSDDITDRDKNAALIAAAPELLAVVIEFVNGCDKAGIKDFNIKYLADARAAIAKAIPN
jgi:hypothetical protein